MGFPESGQFSRDARKTGLGRLETVIRSTQFDPQQPNGVLQRFYGSCQVIRETCRIEFGFVGVDRPGGASDASSEDDEGRRAG